jgi:2-polyprenyl-3-methyl-5-hydroxy-6-metoxy-1,4-benzoquinol methylase
MKSQSETACTQAIATLEIDPALAEVERNWNEFGKRDPLWAILTDKTKKNNQWDLAEFFATGERELEQVLKTVRSLAPALSRGKALDFGCGVGRLTQAMGREFDECHGVDIAESMVEQARHYNRHGDKCHYHVNRQTNLKLFADNTFDFIYTNIVLQHNRPENSRRFIQDFLRILAPDGLLVFQMPSELVTRDRDANQLLFERAFKAQLTPGIQKAEWAAGASETLTVKVRNLSNAVWPGKSRAGNFPIRLANHWRDAANGMLRPDDGKTDLPRDLKPGEEIELKLTVSVPTQGGSYRLELDLVQERWFWFGERGSQTTLVEVTVPGNSAAAPAPQPLIRQELKQWFKENVGQPLVTGNADQEVARLEMDMNGIPREEMLQFLAEHGGRVITTEPDFSAGLWSSYRYYVTKAARG